MLADAVDESTIETVRQAYRQGRSPADVIAEVMARIAGCPRQGIWISIASEGELQRQLQDLRARQAAGKSLPLFGIPFAVKDNIDVAGFATTAACPANSYIPKKSATAVQKLVDAGAIMVGKTNLDQFATGLVGTRSPYGICQNAFDPAWISGGSSSGSAVAVAAGLVPFSLGTDTAGSGRVPAAFNNLVGLKPTRGLVSAAGVVPACRSLDCVSIFASTCADAQLVLDLITGPDSADPLSRPGPVAKLPGSHPLRIGLPDKLEFFGNGEAESLFESAVNRVRKIGGQIIPIDFSPFLRAGELLYSGPWVVERTLAAGPLLDKNSDALRPELRSILQDAAGYTAADVFDGMHTLAGFRRQADEQWARMDMLLAPTAPTIYRISEVEADPMRLNRNLGYYTTFVNLLDLCALAIPAGFLSTGLPWGVTFIAPAFQDGRLLPFAAAFHANLLSENKL